MDTTESAHETSGLHPDAPGPATCTGDHHALVQENLVPVDGSNTSNKALDYALKLAQADQAEVRLIYCIDELSLLSSHEYSGEMVQLARASHAHVARAGADGAGL